jgi:hypothetical protein
VNVKLLITIPGREKREASYWPNETAARDHLENRIHPKQMQLGIEKLPKGSEWVIVATVEKEIARGTVPK